MSDLSIVVSIPHILATAAFVVGIFGLGRATLQARTALRFWILFIGLQSTLSLLAYFGLPWLPPEGGFLYFGELLQSLTSLGMLVWGLLAIVFEKRQS